MSASDRNRLVGARFAKAAPHYEAHAAVQRETARRLAQSIARLPLPARPRILEIGCGTGLLTRELAACLGPADWTITDIAAPMVAAAQAWLALPGPSRFMVADGECFVPPDGVRYDLICSSMALQWFDDLDGGLAHLAGLLVPGGYLAVATLAEDTFVEWRDAHEALGLRAATPRYPAPEAIGARLAGVSGQVCAERVIEPHPDGLHFLRSIKHIGASTPCAGSRPLRAGALKQVLAQFNRQGASVTYHIAYGTWQKAAACPRGVFVTGTDTGVGKTLTSAILARAWKADYWKPLQTGLAVEPGDTETVARLAGLPSERLHAPASILQAPLAPWAAAQCENVTINAGGLALPETDATLIVEGAGGLYVPIDDQCMMIDLIARLALPVVLVARSGLGTINHTLLSLQALRSRRIPVLGVIMNGPLDPGNKVAIERFGHVNVLAEIPPIEPVDARAVVDMAYRIPSLLSCAADMEALAERSIA